MIDLNDYCTFLLGGPSASASSSGSSSLNECFLLLLGGGGDVGTCDGPGSSLVSIAMRNESMSSLMKSSGGCSASGLRGKSIKIQNINLYKFIINLLCSIFHEFTYRFVLELTWFFGFESSESVARTKLPSRTLSVTLRITGLEKTTTNTHE